MEMNRFEQLVKQENGFEFCIGFRDEVDWIIGGKGNRFWFVIRKDGSIKETTEAEIHDSVWKDRMYKGSKKKNIREMPDGSTIRRIEETAYYMQDMDWVINRKPRLIEDSHPHYHYVYGFGDQALDVSEAYGITIGYSNIKDPSSAYHLRYVSKGDEVCQ